jgi:class 3 adenylate cyclase
MPSEDRVNSGKSNEEISMTTVGLGQVTELKSLVHAGSLEFRLKQMETDYQAELFSETQSFGTFTWLIILVSWISLGFLFLLSTALSTESEKIKGLSVFFGSGVVLIAWRLSTSSSLYVKWHQQIQVGAFTALALSGVGIVGFMPERYHAPSFTFFILSILLPYLTANLTFIPTILCAVLMTVIFASFSIQTSSYPTAEGGVFFFFLYLSAANAIGLSLYRYRSQLRRMQFLTNKMLDIERATSEKLLHSIFPEKIAMELRIGNKVEATRLEDVSVIFCDLRGFTVWSAKNNPKRVVQVLDELFSRFDEIAKSLCLDKIKTIGDAYMACSNLTARSDSGAVDALEFGLQAIKTVSQMSGDFDSKDAQINLRVGIATGSVVAGVIGQTKPSYDIWGETVNLASRLESSGASGTVHFCERTFHLIRSNREIEAVEESIDLKGLGFKKTYTIR